MNMKPCPNCALGVTCGPKSHVCPTCDGSEKVPADDTRREAIKEQDRLCHGATLLDVCAMMRMSANGSGDPLSKEETDDLLKMLKRRLATWEKTVHPEGERFDQAVFNLVEATIIEVEWYLRK